MLDIREIRKNPTGIETRLKTKDPTLSLEKVLKLDKELRETIAGLEELKRRRNLLSDEIGRKKAKGEAAESVMEEVGGLGEQIAELDKQHAALDAALGEALSFLPNLPAPSVKVSLDPKENVCLKSAGEKPSFSFPAKSHLEIGEKLGLFDFERGTRIAG